MKKITIALTTFFLGVSAFNLLHSENTAISQVVAPIRENIEVPQIPPFDVSVQKAENSKSFSIHLRETNLTRANIKAITAGL